MAGDALHDDALRNIDDVPKTDYAAHGSCNVCFVQGTRIFGPKRDIGDGKLRGLVVLVQP